jgi:hypothetical protein
MYSLQRIILETAGHKTFIGGKAFKGGEEQINFLQDMKN